MVSQFVLQVLDHASDVLDVRVVDRIKRISNAKQKGQSLKRENNQTKKQTTKQTNKHQSTKLSHNSNEKKDSLTLPGPGA